MVDRQNDRPSFDRAKRLVEIAIVNRIVADIAAQPRIHLRKEIVGVMLLVL